MTVGHKGGKERTIDLVNQARSPLYDYFQQGERKASAYVFTSQRAKKHVSAEEIDGWRWTEDGIHQWWQQLKARARLAEARFINDLDFHESRSRFCAPSTPGWLEPGRGGLLSGAYHEKRDAGHSNHDPVHAGEPRARKRKVEAAPGVASRDPGNAYPPKRLGNVRRGLTYEKNDHQIREHTQYCVGACNSTRCPSPFLPVSL